MCYLLTFVKINIVMFYLNIKKCNSISVLVNEPHGAAKDTHTNMWENRMYDALLDVVGQVGLGGLYSGLGVTIFTSQGGLETALLSLLQLEELLVVSWFVSFSQDVLK